MAIFQRVIAEKLVPVYRVTIFKIFKDFNKIIFYNITNGCDELNSEVSYLDHNLITGVQLWMRSSECFSEIGEIGQIYKLFIERFLKAMLSIIYHYTTVAELLLLGVNKLFHASEKNSIRITKYLHTGF